MAETVNLLTVAGKEKQYTPEQIDAIKKYQDIVNEYIKSKGAQGEQTPVETGLSKLGSLPAESRVLSSAAGSGLGKASLALGDFMRGVTEKPQTVKGQEVTASDIALLKPEMSPMGEATQKSAETIEKERKVEEEKQAKNKLNTSYKESQMEQNLRKEFVARPVVKSFESVKPQLAQLEAALKTGSVTGDMAGIFSLMKVLDPTSVVRPEEYKTGAQAAGTWENVKATINKYEGKGALTPIQRQQILDAATNLANAWSTAYKEDYDMFKNIADNKKINMDFIGKPIKTYERVLIKSNAPNNGETDYASEIEAFKKGGK